MKTYQFQTLNENEPAKLEHERFLDAWLDMYVYVRDALKENKMSLMELEQAIWIAWSEGYGDNCGKGEYSFYEARDTAINLGWQKP